MDHHLRKDNNQNKGQLRVCSKANYSASVVRTGDEVNDLLEAFVLLLHLLVAPRHVMTPSLGFGFVREAIQCLNHFLLGILNLLWLHFR